jgi:hypothetical protein
MSNPSKTQGFEELSLGSNPRIPERGEPETKNRLSHHSSGTSKDYSDKLNAKAFESETLLAKNPSLKLFYLLSKNVISDPTPKLTCAYGRGKRP